MYHCVVRSWALILVTFSFAILPEALFAQTDAPQQVVVVTATKEPQDPLKLTVPVLVSQPTDETSVEEWLATLPGFSFSQTSPGQAALRASTFGDNGFGRIQLLIDGVAQNEPDMFSAILNGVPLAVIDHSETLLTPGSTLYGDQAVAGALNLVTKTPKKPTFEVSATGDLHGGNAESLFWGAPIGQGGILASVQRAQILPQRDHSEADSWNIWLKGWLPTASDQKLTVTGALVWDADQLPGTLTYGEYQSNPNSVETKFLNDKSTQAKQQFTGAWEWTQDLARVTVPLSASMEERTADMVSWPSYTNTSVFQSTFEPRGEWTLNRVAGGDLTLAGELGGSYQRLELNSYNDLAKTSLKLNAVLQRIGSTSRVSLQQNWGDEWFYNAQGRFEATVTTASSDQDSVINNSQIFIPWIFSTGVAWVPQEKTQVALNVGQTFRYPFLDEMVFYSGYSSTDSFNTKLQPETGWDVTLTARTQWNALQAMTTGRILRMNNEIGYDSVAIINVNESASWHYSWTTSLATDPVELPLGAGTGQLSLNDTIERAVFSEGSNEGRILPLVPFQTIKGEASWSPLPFLKAKTSSAWSDSYYQGGDSANALSQVPARWHTDIFFVVHQPKGEGWSLTLFVKNITDDRTPDYVYYSGWYPADGRVLGATVKWAW